MSPEASDVQNVDMGPALEIIEEMAPVRATDIIPLLQQLLDRYGYLPRDVILEVARLTGLPASRIYGGATFYSQFYLEPHGQHTIRCCRGTACHVRGGNLVIDAVNDSLGVDEGETTEDMLFTLETVACLGACALAPLPVVYTKYFGKMTPDKARKLISQMQEQSQS